MRQRVRLHLGQTAAPVGPNYDAAHVAGDDRVHASDRVQVIASVGEHAPEAMPTRSWFAKIKAAV